MPRSKTGLVVQHNINDYLIIISETESDVLMLYY